ncbi:DUF2304 domain-containing protein [Spirosoma utsteinense]|uniref:DUF2304 domain-containing protein n=1 Tax=Spirosoma utsteinense TaxID=2585773 RepID=A0ABR6W0D4_9BACT|nr:DUF2304 domain-containing protein [Spirosoma utsteinense]MBC3783784.1 hypothetical protein [Spirosoma utsteinense]MBC3790072.1 hypothetical protein [Spirosoma utsteinense]
MESLPIVIQILSLSGALGFMYFIARLIIKGKLREEYSFIWIACTIILIVFSIWRKGLEQISLALGVFYPPSLIFLAAIFAIIIFLVHLSVVNSKMQQSVKELTHEIAFLKKELAQLREHDKLESLGTPLVTES